MQSIKAKAFALLAKRAYFSKGLANKLKEKGYPELEIKELIDELQKRGWLNDQELAKRYIEREQKKGYGKRVILQKLREKAGPISVDIEDDVEAVVALISRKYLSKLLISKEKVIGALMRRGLSYELIKKAFNSMDQYINY